MTKLIIASNNTHKIKEINELIGKNINLVSLAEAGIKHDIPENEDTIKGNALAKARYVHNKLNSNVFADDTGLEVDALNGAPGVHSARYAGNDKSSEANLIKLLAELEHVKNRTARFRTIIALIYNNDEYIFEGIVRGNIIPEKKGDGGFGYDPVFVPENHVLTFAEMTAEQKNEISHRSLAIRKLVKFLRSI